MRKSGRKPAYVSQRAISRALGGRLPRPGMRIGLLGGSFNPAHAGHRDIALLAYTRLSLDEVWWMVSPQNPLKESHGMAPLEARMASANRQARHPYFKVTAVEQALGTQATADSITALTTRFPGVTFVWIMGADNLAQIHRWQNWKEIFHRSVIAVFDRPSYSLRAVASRAARRFADARLTGRKVTTLAKRQPPAWGYIRRMRLNPLSATALRNRGDVAE